MHNSDDHSDIDCPAGHLQTGLRQTADAQTAALALQQRFSEIYHQRMIDLPMVNPQLRVEAVGFGDWQDVFLGILVTPWFMNLTLLPKDPSRWQTLQETQNQSWHFPSGHYKFIVSVDEKLGTYQMCSLFSPMFDFADHDTACETAQYALCALMDSASMDTPDINDTDILSRWYPDQVSSTDTAAIEPSITEPRTQATEPRPMSRRELFRLPQSESTARQISSPAKVKLS